MATIIKKIRLINFKRFKDYVIEPNKRINVFIGDNEAGKSSILEAIALVSNGNVGRVESIGLDRLFNMDVITEFLERKERKFDDLPSLHIELYLTGEFDHTMNGKNNSEGTAEDGIRLVCRPNGDYRNEVTEILRDHNDYFPYEYYSIHFSTFADEPYSGYKKKIRFVMIDSSNMKSEYATDEFVRRMYIQYTQDNEKERALHNSQYRLLRNQFRVESLDELNSRLKNQNYSFGLKSGSSMHLDGDLMIYEDKIGIDSKGTGRQIFIKTEFALERPGTNVDIILLEEPENHLSHVNLRKLIQRVADTQDGQIFITTHNSLISTRLELKNILIMHMNGMDCPVGLKDLSDDTAKYFMKTPPASMVEYVLSQKSILVEGPAEYMLMEKFYKSIAKNLPEKNDVHIIDVRGLSFKRYLDIAKLTGSKVAVLTDNDADPQRNCIDKYMDYCDDENIEIFFEKDPNKRTFEVVLYGDNQDLCDKLFKGNAQAYMLNNKTEAAYRLLSLDKELVVPDYIRRAIEWIKG